MAKDTKTEGQIVYERIEELKAGGASLADAVGQVAEERDKKPNAGARQLLQPRQEADRWWQGRSRRSTRTAITVEGAVEAGQGTAPAGASTLSTARSTLPGLSWTPRRAAMTS